MSNHSPTPAAADVRSPRPGSVNAVALVLGITRPTVYKLLREGKLRAYKIGRLTRITADAVKDYQATQEPGFKIGPPCGRHRRPATFALTP